MNKKEKAISALLAAFPTLESWTVFSQNRDNAAIFDSFVDFAVRSNIIKSIDAKSLDSFIRHSTGRVINFNPPRHLDFEELLNKREEMLQLNFSLRALTQRINSLIAEAQVSLPKVTNSMLTRLKKEPVDTPYKQNVLRSLAFWLGHERADVAATWNFETLLKICREGKQTESYREGVRIGFALYSRGDVIDHEILGWLKKTLKNYIEQSISHFLYGRWGKVRSHDITTLYIDFPKEEEAGDLVSYQQCLRSAVSLAHQISIRWTLSKYYSNNRFLSIGIVAGEYANLDNFLLPLLTAKLPGDPVIRVSDYARQCLLICDIRVILCPRPTETTLFNGETLTIWWIVAFWSMLYFDFISDLLEDHILRNDSDSVEKLNQLLWPPAEKGFESAKNTERNAVTTFFKFPHNSLLGVEIAKTLYYRRRFLEAIEILRIVLSIDPTDLTARTLRMVLFRNMAVDAPSYPVALGLFRLAEHEALYIRENCASQSEDFYCEYAVVHLAKAMMTVRHLREHSDLFKGPQEIKLLKQKIFAAFDEAEMLFERGMITSPSGIRSSYLLDSVVVLRAIFKSDEHIFVDPKKPIDAKPEVVRQPLEDIQWQLDFRRMDTSPQLQNDFLKEFMTKKYKIHEDSISLQAYRPTTHFCHVVSLWDFLPIRTVATVERALQLLRDAIMIAKEVGRNDVCIYSFSRTYGEMMPADEFIRHMEKSIQMIEERAGRDFSRKKDEDVIESGKTLSSILMTLNF